MYLPLLLVTISTVCLATPHYPLAGEEHHHHHYHPFGSHQHHGGCRHSQNEGKAAEIMSIPDQYPFIKPTLYHMESGKYAPNQMKDMQDEINKSVQKGIQIYNRNSGGEKLINANDDVEELPIDIRFGNETSKDA